MSDAANRRRVEKSDEEWRRQLTPQQYLVTRLHGTEPAFSHPYHRDKRKGVYRCVCCGAALFSSDAKFDSGTGWPSFFAPVSPEAVSEHADESFFMRRTEIRCAACDAHLGHVFPDGPEPTGLRYCINGVSLSLKTESGGSGGNAA
ncbi:MAG: peptide-methionine (R)-S-oxide reductase MsrB [Methyloligellaceae bacterium]